MSLRPTSKVPTKAFKENYDAIKWDNKAPEKTEAEKERLRKERHKYEVANGLKDAQYYLDHELRVSQNPNYQPKPLPNKAYRDGWERIFGSKKKQI